jgi:hypothetical protein
MSIKITVKQKFLILKSIKAMLPWFIGVNIGYSIAIFLGQHFSLLDWALYDGLFIVGWLSGDIIITFLGNIWRNRKRSNSK